MSAAHSPGPWYTLPEYGNGGEVHYAGGRICDASIGLNEREEYRAHYRPESEANARLIAAAPDLLAALKALLTALAPAIDGIEIELENARAAIAKAEGRS